MAYNQWQLKETTTANSLFRLDTPGVIGETSLIFGNTTAASNRVRTGYVSTASGITRGILHGRIITVVEALETPNANNTFGLFCMASSLETQGTGANYRIQVRGGTTGNVEMYKATGSGIGLIRTHGTLLGTAQDVTWDTLGQTVTLGLEWDSTKQGILGGTQIKMSVGTATDYNDLTEVVSFIDTTSPHTTSLAEGFFILQDAFTVHRVHVEDTRIFTAS